MDYTAKDKVKAGVWVQKHKSEKWGKVWKIHYIEYGTEYSIGEYLTKKEAIASDEYKNLLSRKAAER
jgi:hypothetical protein